MHMHTFEQQLLAALDLLADAPWTSLPAEQQHASLSMLHKIHPEYSPEVLVSRSLLLQMTRILPSATAHDKQVHNVVRRLQKIISSNPDKCSGRHMMIKSMVEI